MPSGVHLQAVRAPGKLVLLGEYAVLEGGPAWVTAIDRDVVVRPLSAQSHAGGHATERRGEGDAAVPPILLRAIQSHGPENGDGGKTRDVSLQFVDGVWRADEPGWTLAAEALTAAFGAEAPNVIVDSSAFFLPLPGGRLEKGGFGSSAAVVVALLALAPDSGARQGDRDSLFRRARAVHQRAQGGAGSGIDIAASVFGGTLRYVLGDGVPEAAPLPLPPGLRILACWSGRGASTTGLLGKVVEWKVSSPQDYQRVMQSMMRNAEEGLTAAGEHDIQRLLAAVDAYGHHMADLGAGAGVPIVTPQVNELRALAGPRAAVKPSGAGGGDMILVYTSDADAPDVQARLTKAGVALLDLGYEATGVTGWSDEVV